MKNKILIALSLVTIAFAFYIYIEPSIAPKPNNVETAKVKSATNQIMAEGTVESDNQAILRFQTGGKLVYLPFKEGDMVNQGALVAQLDSADIQKRLQQALNTYRSTRDSFDQTKDNDNTGVAQGSQKYTLETYNKTSLGTDQETNIINDMVKRIADQNQATLDNSVLNVELAQNAFKLATLYSPISGILTHSDVDTNLTNITPTTTFTISDPNKIIFKSFVLETDINFVEVGASVDIKINNQPNKIISGTVSKIYPEKTKNSRGESVYEVDIVSQQFGKNYQFGQAGTVLIKSKYSNNTVVIPKWLVIDNQYVWVMADNKPTMKKVELGNTFDNQVIILGGLNKNDQLITDPKYLVKKFYRNI